MTRPRKGPGTAILLAAGCSRRAGDDKLAHRLDGEPLVSRAARNLMESHHIGEVLVVVRPGFSLPLPAGCRVVENHRAEEGMGTSLAAGAAAADPAAPFLVIALGDMPDVEPALLDRLVEAHMKSGEAALVPTHEGRRGHPVILDISARGALMALRGDVGAREVLRSLGDQVLWLEVPEPAVLEDLDTRADLRRRGAWLPPFGERVKVLVRGAGEHATGTAHRLFRCGMAVVMTEIPLPLAVRRTVAFSTAVTADHVTVEGVTARRWDIGEAARLASFSWDHVPVFVDPAGTLVEAWRPDVVVDGRLLKRSEGMGLHLAPLVVGLGPGLRAGSDVHVVVETHRGHRLGQLLWSGEAAPDTGVPGPIGGYARERLLRSPGAGSLDVVRDIGEQVATGDLLAKVGSLEVRAELGGVVRGMLPGGMRVTGGLKIGDVDPRGEVESCFTLSDKTRTLSGAVLEAVLRHLAGRRPAPIPDLGPLPSARHVQVVGGGGKTTLLFAWARRLAEGGSRVVTTTSTHIRFPSPEVSPQVLLEPDLSALLERLRDLMKGAGHVTVAAGTVPGTDKLVGYAPEILEELASSGLCHHLLVEADGSAGRPLKAHGDHEPPLSQGVDLVVVVVGLSALGRPSDEDTIHRSHLHRERLGVGPSELVTPEHIASSLLHPAGAIARIPLGARVVVLLTGTDRTAASGVAGLIRRADRSGRVEKILTGNLTPPLVPLVDV